MEPVEELMKRLDLLAAEKKGIKIGKDAMVRVGSVDPKAVGKVLPRSW